MSGILGNLSSGLSSLTSGSTLDSLAFAGDIAGAIADRNWLARLRRASFRGAPFYVQDAVSSVGRRLAQHEFPQRDIPYSEDLGRKQRTWTFTGYMIGASHDSDAARLRRAVEAAGPGTLVHPSLGSVQVTCETAAFNEQRDVGNYISVALTFHEAGQINLPKSTDTAGAADSAASKLTDASGSTIGSLFSTLGQAGYVAQTAIGQVSTLGAQITALRIPGLSDQSSLMQSVGALVSNAPQLVQNVTGLTSATQSVFSAFTDTAPTAAAGYNGALTAATWYADPAKTTAAFRATGSGGSRMALAGVPVTPVAFALTPDRKAEARNTAAWNAFVCASALVEVTYNAPGLELGSVDEAEVIRGQIDDVFEAAILTAADAGQDDLFTALLEARDALLTDLDERITQLPSLVTYRTPRTVNALALAWRLYADAGRAEELVARTDAINPAFMPLSGRVPDR